MARTGKIASLPRLVQDELNRRLLDNERGTTLLPWLNELPEVQAILAAQWDGEPLSDANLTNWRQGGYQDWLKQTEEVERLKGLSAHLARVAEDGSSIYDGLSSVIGGKLMTLVDGWTAEAQAAILQSPKTLIGFLQAMAALQQGANASRKTRLDEKRVKQKDRELGQRERDLDRREREMQMRTAERFIEWAALPEAQQLLTSGKPKRLILGDLMAALFPDPQARQGGGS